ALATQNPCHNRGTCEISARPTGVTPSLVTSASVHRASVEFIANTRQRSDRFSRHPIHPREHPPLHFTSAPLSGYLRLFKRKMTCPSQTCHCLTGGDFIAAGPQYVVMAGRGRELLLAGISSTPPAEATGKEDSGVLAEEKEGFTQFYPTSDCNLMEEVDINECERDPCKNGGICTDLVANYSCECPGEYMGRNCQYSSTFHTLFMVYGIVGLVGDGFSCHIMVLVVLVMCAVVGLMYAQGPAGQGPGVGWLCSSDGRLAGSSLRVAHHCRKVRRTATLQRRRLIRLFLPLFHSECSGPLGMEGGIISNQQITASSTHRALFGLQKWYPYFARLNKKGLVNAWTAAENDRWPWIQINLQRRMRVTGLITQGAKRIGSPEYVKSYKVAYSDDGKTWRTYKVKGKDEDMIFRGNIDNNAPSANSFTPPIEAQYVRIYPQVCRRHCTLRMELLGCELTGCSEPLGMKSGHIQDYQVTASSIFRTLNMDMFTWEPGKARLDKQGKVNAWTAGHSDQSQWLQVDLLVPTKVTGIITQGAKDFGHVQFVGSYKVAYSNDGERWNIYQDEKQGKDKVFQGNFDNDTHRKNVIDPPIYARLIRILPWSWYGRITLRAEILGCTEEE
ncbi:hypothetical protein L3Q82_022978, partial [Scortum barcoo]